MPRRTGGSPTSRGSWTTPGRGPGACCWARASAAAIAAAAPVTVRVTVPRGRAGCCGGRWSWRTRTAEPLAARGDVSLVYDIGPPRRRGARSRWATALRMLAVFSQPTKTSVLALRRERYALSRLIRRIAARRAGGGRAAGGAVRGDQGAAGRDRRLRRRVGRAAPVRARHQRPCSCSSRPTVRRIQWSAADLVEPAAPGAAAGEAGGGVGVRVRGGAPRPRPSA